MKAEDIRAILRALNDANVRYLIVGGLAVVAHGYVRFTQDIDVVIELEGENIMRAMTTLARIGYQPLVPVDAMQFADSHLRQQWREEKGMIVFQMLDPNRESTRLDIFVTEPFEFATEFEKATWHAWGDLRAPVLRLETLIAMKEASGRSQDIADASVLRDILELRLNQR
ncbi:MAG TPA: hypothetical protein VFO22_04770 [Candidatus Udaeobacter sp.]|nr:hypothetical protein [Candidatus Udaeobacter sp.]